METKNEDENSISGLADFWKDAQEFLKTQLPPDFEEKLKEYAIAKKYNRNEFMFFNGMVEKAVGFHGTVVSLKHYYGTQLTEPNTKQ